MKAIDFIRKFGWIEAKIFVEDNISFGDVYDAEMDKYRSVETNLFDLKQYIDAWELVQNDMVYKLDKDKALEVLSIPDEQLTFVQIGFKKAIQLVESVENKK